MKIRLTSFALRHFDKDFVGTKITNVSIDKFHDHIDNLTYDFISGVIKISGNTISCDLVQEAEAQYEATGNLGAGSKVLLTIFMKV